MACWLITASLSAQFMDDFSDGNLDGWEGDISHFIINGQEQLQLDAPSGNTTSWLHTTVVYTDSMTWDIYIRLNFAPSTSNQLRIYLGLDGSNLATASGYFLEIGATGDQDPVELKYLASGTSQPIASSPPGVAGAEPVDLRLRILRQSSGLWQCLRMGSGAPVVLFTATHDQLPLASLSVFGVHCRYTDTRRDKFIFDDIVIGPFVPDTTPPSWTSLEVISATTLLLTFDETLAEQEVLELSNYMVTPGDVHPHEVVWQQHQVLLTFPTPFISQQAYQLQVSGLTDIAGNIMPDDIRPFVYTRIDKALPYELLITEIMADPTPVVGLPDAEYLEVYNATTNIFRLSDYRLMIGTSERVLPDELLVGGEFIIICSEAMRPALSVYGRVIGLASFPALTNSGATVLLKDDSGQVLHEVSYTTAWYGHPGKSDGGYSLEMIHPLHICSGAENWSAADNLLGGTPGSINSRWSTMPDETGPVLLSSFTPTPSTIRLQFNERLDAVLMEDPEVYQLLPAIEVNSAQLENNTNLVLTLATPLQAGVIYEIRPFQAFDCLGNAADIFSIPPFGLIAEPGPGELLIHEVLFNPATGGSRFIEVVNASDKFFNLSSLSIARLTSSQQQIFTTGVDALIGPGELAVFTPNREDILARFEVPNPAKLFTSTLPAWNDKSDQVTLIAGGMILDSFTYSSTWHHPAISDQNGVSLERISKNVPTTSSSSWHSASAVRGHGTPTGPNSQELVTGQVPKSPFSVLNRQFSPNDDGHKDFLALDFLLDHGDYIATVWIYDLEGREIYRPVSNVSIGTSAVIQWDGRNHDGVIADMGIYVIFVQLWDTSGQVREYKESCALVKR